MLIIISLILLSNISCGNADPAVYFIPKKFEGVFSVVYSQRKGNPKEYQYGRRVYRIPSNGILLTQFGFQGGNRQDLFLVKTNDGYDTLKDFLPKRTFAHSQYKIGSNLTTDTSELAVNFRQVITYYPKFFDSDQAHHLDSSFKYELITIGKASRLSDDSLKGFAKRLEKFLRDSLKIDSQAPN